MVAHFTPTPRRAMACAASTVTGVVGGVAGFDPQIVGFELEVEMGQNQTILDEAPDDARHLVAFELDDGRGDGNFCHMR